MMNEGQMMICAHALWMNGYDRASMAGALGIEEGRVQALIEGCADLIAEGWVGGMTRGCYGEGLQAETP